MMRLTRVPSRSGDSIVPMINVAFLLLVFFLMTAVLVPADPLDVTLPVADGNDAEGDAETLVINADGDLAFGEVRGDAVFLALPSGILRVRADASLDGATLARILDRLASHGVTGVELMTVPG